VIRSLPFTLVVEGIICIGYSIWQKKPTFPILGTSIFANLITQSILWVALSIFYQSYLLTLLIVEILIWLIEGVMFCSFRLNQLSAREALILSLVINLSSFGLGWWLPI